MARTLRAYSLGYEGISLDRYVDVLKAHSVSVVIDVRETPWSYKPGFSMKPLAERLLTEGISYVHLKSAGNPAKNRKKGLPQGDVIALYKEHLDSDPSCLEEILTLIKKTLAGSVCLLCFEKMPHDCHRKVILDRLAEGSDKLMTCHLHGPPSSEEAIAPRGIPESNDRKRSRVHVNVS